MLKFVLIASLLVSVALAAPVSEYHIKIYPIKEQTIPCKWKQYWQSV